MADQVDVQAVVDQLARALDLSVLIEDRRQRPVWWSTRGEVDRTRLSTVLERNVSPSAAEVIRRFGLDRATAPVHTPAMPERQMWARWCMPVRHDDRLHGYLWVLDRDGKVQDQDLHLLVECAELAGTVLAVRERSVADLRRQRATLVADLLRRPDPETARELAQLERLPHDVQVQVEAPRQAGGWNLPGSMSAHVVTGRPRPSATSGAPLPLVALGEAVRRTTATLRAVEAGARPTTVSWDTLGPWRLIVDAPDSLEVADLHPAAVLLVDQAREELMTTARVILDLGGDVAAAAAEMHVHRTTLYYRLDRIHQITGIDLKAGAGRTDLQMALWLAAYRRTANH